MTTSRFLHIAPLALGLAAIGWVGAGYIPGSPAALALVLLIGAVFIAGALELQRYRQASQALARLLTNTNTSEPPADLSAWLAQVPPNLQNVVRQRVDGERVALPGPSLAPYLTGLLVLMGMLGTFLGMVVTLKGTGLALESAVDVEAIRASLAAPVKGLGLAFGTSVAGVAASAMLGLMSALARRERQGVGQQLDTTIHHALRGFSRAHQRDQALHLMQQQADAVSAALPLLVSLMQQQAEVVGKALPTLTGQIKGMTEDMTQGLRAHLDQTTRQHQALQDQLTVSQASFHGEAQRAYTGLAASVDQSLKTSLADSARLAGAAIEPAVQATLAGLASQAASLNEALAGAVQHQVDSIGARLDASSSSLAQRWQAALADQQQHSRALTQALQAGLDRFAQTFEQRSAHLLDGMASRLDQSASDWSQAWRQAITQQQLGQQQLGDHTRQALSAAAASLDQAVASASTSIASAVATGVAGFEQQAEALLANVTEAHAALDAAAAAREQQRQAAYHAGLAGLADSLQRDGQQAADAMAQRQQQICSTLEATALAITTEAQAQARATLADVARLVEQASAAPRAAAEVIGELRQALSDSLVRDNAALDERNRLLATLGGLLDAVNHASTDQRAAIDALVQSTTQVLDRVGQGFADTVQAESRSLHGVAAQVSSSAAEVASLGEGFGEAVGLFSRASEQLMGQLRGIEGALGQALARSDEQMAYYVAQAREVIDLTLGAQRQIVDDLQQLARPAAATALPSPLPAAQPAGPASHATTPKARAA